MTVKSFSARIYMAIALSFWFNSLVFATNPPFGGDSTATNTGSRAINLSANLSAAAGYAGEGYIRYNADSQGGSLQAAIQLPIDGATLRDSATASTATLTLTISDGGKTIANCTLGLTEIGSASSGAKTEIAEYQASIFETGADLTANDGACSGNALPKPVSGDTISVTLTGGNSSVPVLIGTFGSAQIRRR
jgi:hypothetical protein